jgi:A/G-specific adenine glycosylase
MAGVSVNPVRKLAAWYRKNSRDLPWRKSSDPYRVWLSEIMLQQTQVKTVIPYFERFIARFPEVSDLAEAEEEEVFKLWAGLGYYSRARNLHRGAKALAERLEKGEGYPEDRESWLSIPGVGPYTAGAVLSIAFNLAEPIVDGNVVRVFSRLKAIREFDPKHARIWRLAREWVSEPSIEPSELNQGLMELGALVCKPKNPDCASCPLRMNCRGRKNPMDYPKKKKRVEWIRREEAVRIVFRAGNSGLEVLLRKNNEGPWRKGLWDFPTDFPPDSGKKAEVLAAWISTYTVTRHRVTRNHELFCYRGSKSGRVKGSWFPLEDLPALPAPTKKALDRAKGLLEDHLGPI